MGVKVKKVIIYKCDLCGTSVKIISNGYDETWQNYNDNMAPKGWHFINTKLYCSVHQFRTTVLVDSLIVDKKRF